jgi:hypothetical protein
MYALLRVYATIYAWKMPVHDRLTSQPLSLAGMKRLKVTGKASSRSKRSNEYQARPAADALPASSPASGAKVPRTPIALVRNNPVPINWTIALLGRHRNDLRANTDTTMM